MFEEELWLAAHNGDLKRVYIDQSLYFLSGCRRKSQPQHDRVEYCG